MRLDVEVTLRPDVDQESIADWLAERIGKRGHAIAFRPLSGDRWLGEAESDEQGDEELLRADVADWLESHRAVYAYAFSSPREPVALRSRSGLSALAA